MSDGTGNLQQWGVQGRDDLKQRHLRQQVKVRSATRAILPGSVEEIPQGRKYLETIIYNSTPKKAD